MIFFIDSSSLNDYVKKNNVITWYGDYGRGNLLFVDSSNVHVVFDSRSEYEEWVKSGRPLNFQISLF